MRYNFRYYRGRAAIKLRLWISLAKANVAGALVKLAYWVEGVLVKLAYWISPTLEQQHREIYGRAYAMIGTSHECQGNCGADLMEDQTGPFCNECLDLANGKIDDARPVR